MRDSLEARDSILVIGASGQLGLALCQEFGSTYNVVAASRSYVDRGQHYVDLADEPGLMRLLDDVQANTILIAAAMCHVDRCELEPKVCHSVQQLLPSLDEGKISNCVYGFVKGRERFVEDEGLESPIVDDIDLATGNSVLIDPENELAFVSLSEEAD